MGRLDFINALLAGGADFAVVDSVGQTAMHLAAANGHLEVVQRILRAEEAAKSYSRVRLTLSVISVGAVANFASQNGRLP